MKALIGIDMRETATGALQFAAWLARARSDAGSQFLPVHVLEESYLLQILRHTHLEAVEKLAQASCDAQLEHAGLAGIAAPARVVRGIEATDALVRELDAEHAEALIVGRQAPTTERRLVRLGRVARRLVRRLPCPIVVVPPDVRAETIGAGPIVLATDLEATSLTAARFAERISAMTGRPLVVAHVAADDLEAARYLSTAAAGELFAEVGPRRQEDLERWMASHGLGGRRSIVASGEVIPGLARIIELEGAPLVVCGSRGLGAVERVFVASVGVDLACWAGCAVAIVPPTWGG